MKEKISKEERDTVLKGIAEITLLFVAPKFHLIIDIVEGSGHCFCISTSFDEKKIKRFSEFAIAEILLKQKKFLKFAKNPSKGKTIFILKDGALIPAENYFKNQPPNNKKKKRK